MGTLVRNNSEDDKDERLKHLQAEMDAMRAQMLGQVTIIQSLAQRQGELKVLVNQLLRDNQLGQTSKVEKQDIIQPPVVQEDKGKAPQFASGSQAQHQPHQRQQGNRRKRNTSGRHFSETGIPSSLILRRLLEVKLIALKDPPKSIQGAGRAENTPHGDFGQEQSRRK